MLFTCKRLNEECTKRDLSAIGSDEPPVPVPGAIQISASVGIRGKNLPADTTTIQDALNRIRVDQGGANPRLVIDGKCGPKTQKAIQMFQLKHFGWKGADGLVEPFKQTIGKMNALLSTTPFAAKGSVSSSPSSSAVVLPDLTESFRRAMLFVLAAQTNLLAASTVLEDQGPETGLSTFGREFKIRELNKHFAIDKFSNKRQMFRLILKVYDRMRQVFERPGGLWGPATFQPDELNDKNLAYTNFGGFFRSGQFRFHKGKRIRLDTIFISAPFLTLPNDDQRALVHIHELAHFVGQPEFIDDHAYNFQAGGAKIRALSPQLRLLNAESYSNFAWGAAHPGSDPPI